MTTEEIINEARKVIANFAGADFAQKLTLEVIDAASGGLPVFEIANGGRVVRGSSTIAICHGFYDQVRLRGAGIYTWSGKRFDEKQYFGEVENAGFISRDTNLQGDNTEADSFKSTNIRRVVSPFLCHQYFNVCTFGYTMAFWDEARWDEEFEYMALHGYDMPILLCGAEAIGERVWRRLGLSQEAIDAHFPGGAYLPWFHMGNICRMPFSQDAAWRARTVRIQHHLLERAAKLGMTPIVPGFGGMVPYDFRTLYPNEQYHELLWGGHVKTYILSPESPVFRKIERIWVEEYQREFGNIHHFLCDSFNEMNLPWTTAEETQAGLAKCGEMIFGGLRDADKEAIWVMQGWMFVYQPQIWTRENYQALVSTIPDNAMLVLYIGADWTKYIIGNGSEQADYERVGGFLGKPWTYGLIPDMGGDVIPRGAMEFYANGHLEPLASLSRGNLVGISNAPEGIETLEVAHELISDSGWRTKWIDLLAWLQTYAKSRYGKAPDELRNYYRAMLSSVWDRVHGHPNFLWNYRWTMVQNAPSSSLPNKASWQQWNCMYGGDAYPEALQNLENALSSLEKCLPMLGSSPLFMADLHEMRATVYGARAESYHKREREAFASGNEPLRKSCQEQIRALLTAADNELSTHPLYRLDRWMGYAKNAAEGDNERAKRYLSEAFTIITAWGPLAIDDRGLPYFWIEDYSLRYWNGLIKNYYLSRLETMWTLDGDLDATEPREALNAHHLAFLENAINEAMK